MFAGLRSGFVFAALGWTTLLPTTASAQWFGWGWGWDEPGWVSYYPGSYGGYRGSYGAYYAPGGCGCDPYGGCAPCGCAPCGCDPCCNPCGSACGAGGCSSGNCAGGNCSYDAPANGAPVPDPNMDAPPVRPRTTPNSTTPRTTPRTSPRTDDSAPAFEPPSRGTDSVDPRSRSRSTDPLDDPQPMRTRDRLDPGAETPDPFDAANPDNPRSGSGTGSRPGFPDSSTAPAGGSTRPRPFSGNTDPLDPANRPFDANKPELPAEGESTIRQRQPAEAPVIEEGTGRDDVAPKLDLKATSAPVVPKARLATLSRKTTASHTAAKPAIRDWSAAMTEPRWLR